MRKKGVLTIGMLAIAVVAVGVAAWSYKGIGEKMQLEEKMQSTMSLTELETEEDVSEKQTEKPSEEITQQEKESEYKEEGTEEGNSELPDLKLKSERVEIKIGESFDQLSQVESVTDNKDTPEMLYRTIWIHGLYDTYVPGEYKIQYVVTDSDGNQSIAKILTLVVKE